jgi:CIC family chloride channel protein
MLYPTGEFNERRPLPDANPNFRLTFVALLAAVIGVAAGLVAFLLLQLIALITNLVFFQQLSFVLRPIEDSHLGFWVLVVPALGGLIIGLMAKYGSPKIKGHGIPEAMEAVLTNKSRIKPSVALLKPISTAIAIGTGGPFGAEGPIIQTGGAIGSLFGQVIRTTASERKVLLASGAAAGMAAIFNTPIAAVILAIELLLFEFKSRSFIPLVIASTLATSVHFLLIGRDPVFAIAEVAFGVPQNLPWYVLLGLLCGGAAVGFTKLLYWVEDRFESLPVNEVLLPAIGGLGLGLIGFFVPRVLGVGYETITDILNGRLAFGLLVAVMVFKALALLVSLGSGTSGGLLAPMFMSSAAMGAVFATAINTLIPGVALAPEAFALAAMGAVFGAASRATFTFIIFAFEITQDYTAILPLMLVGVISSLVALHFLKTSIMTEKLARRGLRVHSDYEADVLHRMTVAEVMDPQPPTIPMDMPLSELANRIAHHDRNLSRHHGLLIVDNQRQPVGIITRSDLLNALEADGNDEQTVYEAGSKELVVTFPDESLHEASSKMLLNDVGRLPVVARNDSTALLGYLGRTGILAARQQLLHEEHQHEPGWLAAKVRKAR